MFPSLLVDSRISMSSGTKNIRNVAVDESVRNRNLKSHSEFKELDEVVAEREKDDK